MLCPSTHSTILRLPNQPPTPTQSLSSIQTLSKDFAAAWTKLTELGCPTLSSDSIVNIERKADGEAVEAALVDVATACTQ